MIHPVYNAKKRSILYIKKYEFQKNDINGLPFLCSGLQVLLCYRNSIKNPTPFVSSMEKEGGGEDASRWGWVVYGRSIQLHVTLVLINNRRWERKKRALQQRTQHTNNTRYINQAVRVGYLVASPFLNFTPLILLHSSYANPLFFSAPHLWWWEHHQRSSSTFSLPMGHHHFRTNKL